MARTSFGLNYQGSSGYWAGTGTGGSGAGMSGGYVEGLGYPGDASRKLLERGYPLPTRYQTEAVTTRPTNTADLYNPIAITKNPWLKDFVGSLQGDLNKITMPDFTAALNALKASQGDVNTAFDRYGSAMNLGDYIGAQRGGDAEARARTGVLAGDVNALGSRYDDVLAQYQKQGEGALGDELRNAEDFSGRLIPKAITDAYSQVQKNAKLYDFARPGGYSSAIAGKVASESTRAALPYMLEGSRYTGNVLGKYQPFYGDVASRQANKVANFDYPVAAAMYDRYGNVIAGEKATAANIQQLQMAVAREGVDMAIRKHVTDFQSAQMLAQIANMPLESILQRAQAAGVLGGMSPMYQYEGLEYKPGVTPTPSQNFSQSLPAYPVSNPGYPPSRYAPTPSPAPPGQNVVGGWPTSSPTSGPPAGFVSRGNPTWDAQYGYVASPGTQSRGNTSWDRQYGPV